MFKNFILTAFRNLKRNKLYALLNVLGLALGIGCSLVIYKIITFELSFDKYQPNYDKIYRIVKKDSSPDGEVYGQGLPHPFIPALKEEIAIFDEAVAIHYAFGDQINVTDSYNNLQKYRLSSGIAFSTPEIMDMFHFEIIAGDAKNTLSKLNHAIISTSVAELLYGSNVDYRSVIGNTFSLAGKVDITISAIMNDPPKNTDFPIKMLISYGSLKNYDKYYLDGTYWKSSTGTTQGYVLYSGNPESTRLKNLFYDFVVSHWDEEEAEGITYYLQPLNDIHFNGNFYNFSGKTASINLMATLAIIGIFLVVTACINFINLATAQAVKRSKEIGIRKAMGVSRYQLIAQFLSETLLISVFALALALVISTLMLQNLEDLIGYKLSLNLIDQPTTLVFIGILLVFVTFLSGFYPAILLSKMEVISALKNKLTGTEHGGGLSIRRSLVIAQFSISQALIIGTIVVGSQMNYFLNKDLGFDSEAVITAGLPSSSEQDIQTLKNFLLRSPDIKDVTFSTAPPTGNNNLSSYFNHPLTHSDKDYKASFKAVDDRYIDFFGIKILAGRKFRASDNLDVAIINQKTFGLLNMENYEDAIGLSFKTTFGGDKKIVGIMEDFHNKSLREELDYVFLVPDKDLFYEVSIKLAIQENGFTNTKAAIKHFEDSWNVVYPEIIFDYIFLDEDLARSYDAEQRISTLFKIFAGITIFIGCLGLYGLISFISMQRIKEIGVRKVLGASVWNIINIFSKELIILSLVAFAIAAPISYYFLNEWLNKFKYRVDLTVTDFLISIGVSFLIALFTVGYKTYFAATLNPSESLKDE